ncbi:MAG TPA: hypothetical protein VEU08_24770 [Vicinamibacterales bacterium]|nr:hypothetical protein [Vicinamibacterales bacterium]
MRRTTLRGALAALLAVNICIVLVGQDNWYASYQDGVNAFKAGDYPTAEKKLLAALNNSNAPTKRGKQGILYYGQLRGEFLPEYWLALTYAKLNRWVEVVQYATLAEKNIKKNDAEYPKLAAARSDAQKNLNAALVAANGNGRGAPTGATGATGATGVARGTGPVPEDPAVVNRRNFSALMADVGRFTTSGQYAEARVAVGRARALNVDNAAVDAAQKTIDIQDYQKQISTQLAARRWTAVNQLADQLAVLDPANPLVQSARRDVAHGIASDEARVHEREGLSAFYRGNYQGALDALARIADDVRTPRDVFYQACSTAAIGLMQNDKTRLERARALYLQARSKDNPFTVERKYVSPKIVGVLDGTR